LNDLSNPYAGGAEVHLEEILRRLVRAGHEVTLFCSGWEGCKSEETIEGVNIIRRGNRLTFNWVAPMHLRRLCKQEQFDVLVEDINKIPFYTPYFLDIKTLVVIPHLFATTVFQEINPILGTYIYLAEIPMRWAYRGMKVNVISESTASDIEGRGWKRDDISIVYCGIDHDVYNVDKSLAKYDNPTILYLGRIKKYKCVQHLIAAFSRVKKELPDARLMVVGEGDYLPELKKMAASLGLEDDVEFPGFVSTANKVERMRRSHVAVLPSLKEGWGLTNIEANATGTTVIAADSPGLRDSVRDGETGYLYPWGDIDTLTDRLLKVLTDDEQRRTLERGGIEWAAAFSWDNAASEIEQLLLKMTGAES
jgi:glycosyltransferase involved in cell wall biosynthesis